METKELLQRLGRIEEALTAKGHPMQDYSTIRMALLDLIEVLRRFIDGRDQ